MTPEERNEIQNQILLVGQLHGLASRINAPLLEKWLSSGEVQEDFRYEKQVLAAIKFQKEI